MLDRPLILTGFMGAGKSSVGRVLARKLGCRFIDLDDEIVAGEGRSINEIFAEDGEAVFRGLESACLEHVLRRGAAVIATGGGAVNADANRALMRATGVVVNLTASFDRILKRLAGSTSRPLFAGDDPVKRAKTLMEQREQFYEDADIRIDTDGKSVEDVAAEILNYLDLKGLGSVKVVTVNLGESSYDIQIESGSLPDLGQRCVSLGLTGRAAVVTNPTVNALYGDTVRCSLASAGYAVSMVEIPDGEEFKNTVTLNSVYDALIEAGLDRKSFIVALGGGVVGDLAGFAAATFLRGIPFVQVPTTLLAQVDSSVGGKTAIDHPRGKNLIGAFYQPRLVLIDVETLSTLPKREYCAGLAEVVKYGVAIDGAFFDYLERHTNALLAMERECLMTVIQRCCELKAHVVELDEKETGPREALNYGHTLGHALETMAGYRCLVHGEAVAIGMALAARICALRGECGDDDVARIIKLLGSLGLSVTPPAVESSQLMDAVLKDKKSRDGSINFICNRGIGNYTVARLTPEELLKLSGLGV